MPVLRDILTGAALTAAFAPARAWAGDNGLPRTEVIHKGEACLTRVDRSVDPVVHLEYTIPLVDVCLTEDEPADSRTHQFVTFCRDALPYTIPPWISWADVDSSLAADPAIRSRTSVCLTVDGADEALIKRMAGLLEAEGAAYDIAGYRDAPPGLRIWCGATVDTADIEALGPWLDWAYSTAQAA